MPIGTITVGSEGIAEGSNPATNPGDPGNSSDSDIMLIHDYIMNQSSTPNTPSTPSGWQLLDTFLDSNSDSRHTYFWRVGPPAASTTVALSGTSTTFHRSRMYRIPGARVTGAASDIFVLGAQSRPAGSASQIGPITGLTTPEPGCAVFVGAGRENDLSDGTSIGTLSQSGLTFIQHDSFGNQSANDYAMVAASAIVPNSGTVISSKSWSISATSSADLSIGQMIAIRPAPVVSLRTGDHFHGLVA